MKYPPAFEAFWQAYPKRDGPNPKREAWYEWEKRLAEGDTAQEMIHGAQCYAAAETKFIVHARRFLHGAWYEEYENTVVKEYRETTADEQRAWFDSGALGPPPARTEAGKVFWLPKGRREG